MAAPTLQALLDRALDRDLLNRSSSLQPASAILIAEVQRCVTELLGELVTEHRAYFRTSVAVTSTNAASARVIDLGALTGGVKVQRVEELWLTITYAPAGPVSMRVNPVDFLGRLTANDPPRYYAQRETIIEVNSDWGPTGAVSGTLYFEERPADLDVTGNLTQTLTTLIPERFAYLIVNRLARYFHAKDVNRDPGGLADLDTEYGGGILLFKRFAADLTGSEVQANTSPPPDPARKK